LWFSRTLTPETTTSLPPSLSAACSQFQSRARDATSAGSESENQSSGTSVIPCRSANHSTSGSASFQLTLESFISSDAGRPRPSALM
jgi:hypothetical protein